MIDKSNLLDFLSDIEVELRKSSKSETADFFQQTRSKIKSVSDRDELKMILQELSHSGAMVQYANFSYQEEQLFDKCYEEVKNLLSVI